MSKPQKLLAGLSLIAGAFALLLWPQESTRAAKDGLMLCYNVILPSLFPFFVLSSLSVDLGFTRLFGRLLEPVMRPLFRISGAGASAFALGCIGGYPVGAKTAVSLYESGQCSRSEAHRLLAFCNNCGVSVWRGRGRCLWFLLHRASALWRPYSCRPLCGHCLSVCGPPRHLFLFLYSSTPFLFGPTFYRLHWGGEKFLLQYAYHLRLCRFLYGPHPSHCRFWLIDIAGKWLGSPAFLLPRRLRRLGS